MSPTKKPGPAKAKPKSASEKIGPTPFADLKSTLRKYRSKLDTLTPEQLESAKRAALRSAGFMMGASVLGDVLSTLVAKPGASISISFDETDGDPVELIRDGLLEDAVTLERLAHAEPHMGKRSNLTNAAANLRSAISWLDPYCSERPGRFT